MATQSPLLAIRGLNKAYGPSQALKDLSLSLQRREVLVLIGPSGCGKSTLLRCINGLEQIQSGTIELSGVPITHGKTDWSRVRQRVGMVFQSYDLFPHMNVLENVLLGPLKVQRRARAEAEAQAETLMRRVGLWEKHRAYPRELSGGQKQRVAIVRALMMKPEIMLFDEITAALDPEMVREVLDVMLDLAQDGMTMIIVTHEMAFARAVADRVLFMDMGEIVESGSPQAFFEQPDTDRARKFLDIFRFD